MIYSFSAQTHVGQVRSNNEDSVAFEQRLGLGILADGMGGYNAGEVASGMATAFIKSEMVQWLDDAGEHATLRAIRQALEVSVEKANLSIYRAATTQPQYNGMGTTLVVCVFHENALVLGHIGDSRAYLLRRGQLTQLTKDHSVLQEQIDAGLITPEQARTSNQKNLVTRAVGVEVPVGLEVHEHQVLPGDTYLLCSDGLSDMLEDAQISEILQTAQPAQALADSLVQVANAKGGRDNITVLLVQVTQGSEKRGLLARLLGK